MRCTSRTAFVLALGFLAVGAADASAAWNNVFQTTCCGGNSTRSSYFAPEPAPSCCPTVTYVQRCYYQPVTTYKYETYSEPVTSYRTSYYWEPTTRYRYTSYYDPCTGCCQRVCTPYTSYSLKSQCNAVQSYVQRCRLVPVTEMRKSYYMEPVLGCNDPCGNSPAGPVPGVSESGDPVRRGSAGNTTEPPRLPAQGIPESRPVPQRETLKPARPDRVASLSNAGRLQGTLVRDDRITPQPHSVLKFVNADRSTVTARSDGTGQFNVELPAGEWTLFVPGRDGRDVFHSTLNVRNTDDRTVTVVSR